MGERSPMSLWRLSILTLGSAGLLLAFLTSTWEAPLLVLPLLAAGLWALYTWHSSAAARKPRHLEPAPDSGPDPRLAVVVFAPPATAPDQVVASLARARAAAGTVILCGDEQVASLAATYAAPFLAPSQLSTGFDSLLPSTVSLLMPVDAGAILNPPAVHALAALAASSQALSVSGVATLNPADAYVSSYAADSLADLLASARAAGSPLLVDNATILARTLLTTDTLAHVSADPACLDWGAVLRPGKGEHLATDLMVSRVGAPASSSSFWPRRLMVVAGAVDGAMQVMRHGGHARSTLPVLASALKGWPLLVLFWAPAVLALTGMSPARIPLLLWLAAAFAVPAMAWAADMASHGSWKAVNPASLSVLYELPVSLVATLSAFGSRYPSPGRVGRVPVWILVLMGFVSADAAGLGAAAAFLYPEDSTLRLVCSGLALFLALGAFAAAVQSLRLLTRDRGSARTPAQVPVTLRSGSADPQSATLSDVSFGGAMLLATLPVSVGQLLEVEVEGQSFTLAVVRVTGTGFAVRAEDPAQHLLWVSWVGARFT